ncbi:dipeptidase PepV [Clostridium sp.]|uniref:dipeptidase PepV n=1 Tax=Clostridium sp. TaxID=1506 RepID=UPI0034642FEB
MISKKVDELKDQLVRSTQEIIRIKSLEGEGKEGMPFGEAVNNALLCALKISEDLGFKTKNIDGYAGYAEYGEGDDYVAVLGHLDVVPEGEGWTYDPYGAEIHGGRIYGRGTTDDKGPMMAALYGLKAIKDLDIPLSKKVRIIFGTNEETGSNDLPYYLKKEKPPVLGFTPDAEYPIIYAEKGILHFTLGKTFNIKDGEIKVKSIKAGERPNIVPSLCEALVTGKDMEYFNDKLKEFNKEKNYHINIEPSEDGVKIKSHGVSAHGSTPHLGKNAIMHMIMFLNTLDIKGDLKEFLGFLSESIGTEVNGEGFGVGYIDEPSGKLTLNVGIINLCEDKADLRIDIRYPVTINNEELLKKLEATSEKANAEIKDIDLDEPLYFSKDHELIKKLQIAYEEITGDKAELIAIGGGTYAKSMPNTVAFGPIFPGKPDVIHKPDEYIEIEDLISNAKIYGRAIYELAK